MKTEPRIEHRPCRLYVGIATTTSMQQEAEAVPAALNRLKDWMDSHAVQAEGPPFVRYRRIDMPDRLDIEVCLPVAAAAGGGAELMAGELPAGRYAVLVHTGPVEELVDANAALQAWARRHRVGFAVEETGSTSVWAARIETTLTGPGDDADPQHRKTEIAYLLA